MSRSPGATTAADRTRCAPGEAAVNPGRSPVTGSWRQAPCQVTGQDLAGTTGTPDPGAARDGQRRWHALGERRSAPCLTVQSRATVHMAAGGRAAAYAKAVSRRAVTSAALVTH